MDIPGHKKRFVIIAALEVYGRALAAARKASESAHCSTSYIDENQVVLEHLQAEYAEGGAQLTLDGTPMGEQLTKDHYQDDDGTSLTADDLDRWLRETAGCYVPYAVIAEWVLEKRKLVAAWLRPIDTAAQEAAAALRLDAGLEADAELPEYQVATIREDTQRIGRTCAPDFIDVAWFTPPVPVAPVEETLSTEDVDKWITAGPWGVASYEPEGATPGKEWELLRVSILDAGQVVDRSKKFYQDVETARQAAAKLNRDMATVSTSTGPALVSDSAPPKKKRTKKGEGVTEPAATEPAPLHPE